MVSIRLCTWKTLWQDLKNKRWQLKFRHKETGDPTIHVERIVECLLCEDVIDKLPKFITPMPSKQIRFSCFINIFGGIKYVNEDDVNDVLKLIRGNNLLETDEWKGDVNE